MLIRTSCTDCYASTLCSSNYKVPGVLKNFNCLISCQLKTTVFTQSVVIFSKLSNFNLKIGIKQSKIG